ncbi:type II toxin-antitoxin system VapC family toxin [Rathayibacter soli]|uniref:type II toxin-antitoxin system VapC family toxin n=1 Tax=Rathayibacter soli TaxID=3144168 RepID=UPI0027E42866|nr:type II toxin-antitoxin system VapC family toxin [Glaciibacter superstes]
MRIYVDSSALIKRAVDEPESDALVDWLEQRLAAGDTLASSSLAWVEVTRALRTRLDHEHPSSISELADVALSGLSEFPLDARVVALARRIGPPILRTPDALHLASATLLDADLLVAYDARLGAAAAELGIRTVAPAPPVVE